MDAAAHPWTVRLDSAGSGSYIEAGNAAAAPIPLTISTSTLERLRRGERAVKHGRCESKLKNIAKTGEKTIRYQSSSGDAECTFNFSDDASLMDASEAFQSIAETMQAGERLQHELRYDRLGLDAEMEALLGEIREGTAIEVKNIAPILQSLVDDEHVIDRVRRKAARLLQDPDSAASGAGDRSAR